MLFKHTVLTCVLQQIPLQSALFSQTAIEHLLGASGSIGAFWRAGPGVSAFVHAVLTCPTANSPLVRVPIADCLRAVFGCVWHLTKEDFDCKCQHSLCAYSPAVCPV